ncbi:MAG: DUF4394 domain-containing protein [Steroidobacteraceae bacterium]|nr:DUF4394 domain-containing protein [Steroidobacteraceae bacterium]
MTSGDTFGITSTTRLVTFDRADSALDTAIAVTGLSAGETLVGLDVRAGGSPAGEIYALSSTGRLFTVNPTSGVATLKATLSADAGDATEPFAALSGTEFGVDFNPVGDRLRIVSDTGQNLRVDADTGATITDAPLASGASTRAGIHGAAYTNAFADACRTALYYIDSTTDQLLTTTDPNGGSITVVGALGVDASAASDLEIATAADGTNTGYAVLVVGGTPTSYQINLSTGAAASGSPVTRLDANELVRDTAIAAPTTAPIQARGDVYALTAANRLLSINSAAPAKVCTSAAITGQQSGENIVGIDVRPADGVLYALGSTGRLYSVDPATAALTVTWTLAANLGDSNPYTGLLGTEFGFDFNPGNDLVRVVSDAGENFRVFMDTGLVTTDTAPNPAGSVFGSAAYSNNFLSAGTASYYTIDSTTDSLQVIGRTSGNAINGDILNIGTLGADDVTSVGGFDIRGTNNLGLAAVTIGANTTSELFNVNLVTGAATRLATVAGGERVRGLAYATLPVATVIGLTGDNHLVTFKPLTPGTLDTDVAVTGLQGAEAIVGIDTRPSNGAVYALTDAGRLYTLDVATGALAGAVTLAANVLDLTVPFTALVGTRFGVDFSPLDDQLRVQSDTGQNLRVNVMTGEVITDGNLNPGTPQIVGTAFTNPYAGAAATTHYALDLAGNTLVRHTSVSGLLATVGAGFNAGTTFALEGGFDIAGGENGLPVAALVPTGATQSTLYRVNLGNGSLTSLGAIGTSTTVISALTVRLR